MIFFNFIVSIKKSLEFLESNECKFPFRHRVMKANVSLHIKNTSHILYIYVCGALHVKKNNNNKNKAHFRECTQRQSHCSGKARLNKHACSLDLEAFMELTFWVSAGTMLQSWGQNMQSLWHLWVFTDIPVTDKSPAFYRTPSHSWTCTLMEPKVLINIQGLKLCGALKTVLETALTSPDRQCVTWP